MLTVERVQDLEGLKALGARWGELLDASPSRHAFLTHAWIVNWWRHFGAGRDLWVLLVKEGERLAAIAPLMMSRQRAYGLPIARLAFMLSPVAGNKQADFILGSDPQESLRAIAEYWAKNGSEWDLICLDGIPEESPTLALLEAAVAGLPLRHVRKFASGWLYQLRPRGTWHEFVKSKSRGFRKSQKAISKRLERLGPVDFERCTLPETVEVALERVFEVERNSWKARAGTAVALNDHLRGFYTDVAVLFCRLGQLEIRILNVAGRPVASTMNLVYEGVVVGLKNSYDMRYSEASPGTALFFNFIEDSWARGARRIDFNGQMPYLGRWSDHICSLGTLYVFNTRAYSRLLERIVRLHLFARRIGRRRYNSQARRLGFGDPRATV